MKNEYLIYMGFTSGYGVELYDKYIDLIYTKQIHISFTLHNAMTLIYI